MSTALLRLEGYWRSRQPAAENQIAGSKLQCQIPEVGTCRKLGGSYSVFPRRIKVPPSVHTRENPLDLFLESASKQSAWVWKPGARSPSLDHSSLRKLLLPALTAALFSGAARCQSAAFGPASPLADAPAPVTAMPTFDVSAFRPGTFDEDAAAGSTKQDSDRHRGMVERSVKRTLEDQKEIYKAPFKTSNLRWDALVLAPTALFLVTDRHIENNLPGGHYTFYQDASDLAIGGLAASLAGVWIYGIKGDHPHAKETGELELETLVNTFLVYAPMQYIAARQRPGEGNGHGDFLRHAAVNTSFPGGHAMFTWAMATVAAQEYPKPWIKVLTYTAAFTVTTTRYLARDHWASDMWVGTALGIAIGTHVFHAHCDPELTASCARHHEKMLKRKAKLADSPLASWPNAKPSGEYASGRPPEP